MTERHRRHDLKWRCEANVSDESQSRCVAQVLRVGSSRTAPGSRSVRGDGRGIKARAKSFLRLYLSYVRFGATRVGVCSVCTTRCKIFHTVQQVSVTPRHVRNSERQTKGTTYGSTTSESGPRLEERARARIACIHAPVGCAICHLSRAHGRFGLCCACRAMHTLYASFMCNFRT